jgi:hypothetical protein
MGISPNKVTFPENDPSYTAITSLDVTTTSCQLSWRNRILKQSFFETPLEHQVSEHDKLNPRVTVLEVLPPKHLNSVQNPCCLMIGWEIILLFIYWGLVIIIPNHPLMESL